MSTTEKKSHSTSETGIEKNIINFETLTAYCVSYGAAYNPSRTAIKLPALNTIDTNAKSANLASHTAMGSYDNLSDIRELAFKPSGPYLTRVMNYVKSLGLPKQTEESVRKYIRKLSGKRTTPKLTPEQIQELEAQGEYIKQISVSQMSYDMRLDNFDKLIKFLETIPEYNPNENDLKLTALNFLYNDLLAKNTAVANAIIVLKNARIVRNDVIYKETTGLVDIALDVKAYIKAVFGASSPQYKNVAKLKFTRIKVIS